MTLAKREIDHEKWKTTQYWFTKDGLLGTEKHDGTLMGCTSPTGLFNASVIYFIWKDLSCLDHFDHKRVVESQTANLQIASNELAYCALCVLFKLPSRFTEASSWKSWRNYKRLMAGQIPTFSEYLSVCMNCVINILAPLEHSTYLRTIETWLLIEAIRLKSSDLRAKSFYWKVLLAPMLGLFALWEFCTQVKSMDKGMPWIFEQYYGESHPIVLFAKEM